MSEASRSRADAPGPKPRRWTIADALSASRVPLAIAFVLVDDAGWRLAILAVAAATDLLDGHIARRFGSSRIGAVVDPIADKLFMACAFGVVAFSGQLEPFEIVGVLIRDIVATIAFALSSTSGRLAAVPARIGGKAVTVGQILTLAAFLLESAYLRPMAWATAAVGLYAIWDYQRESERRRTGKGEQGTGKGEKGTG